MLDLKGTTEKVFLEQLQYAFESFFYEKEGTSVDELDRDWQDELDEDCCITVADTCSLSLDDQVDLLEGFWDDYVGEPLPCHDATRLRTHIEESVAALMWYLVRGQCSEILEEAFHEAKQELVESAPMYYGKFKPNPRILKYASTTQELSGYTLLDYITLDCKASPVQVRVFTYPLPEGKQLYIHSKDPDTFMLE